MSHSTREGAGQLTHWLIQVRNGDQAAFEQLCTPESVHRWLLAIAAALPGHLRPKIDPEDILQDALQKAWSHIGDLKDVSARGFHHWVLEIAYNAVYDSIRAFDRKKRKVAREERFYAPPELVIYDDQHLPWKTMARGDQLTKIADVIDQLKKPYRDIIVHRILEDHSPNEVSSMTGMSTDNVHVTLHRAMRKLRQLLEQKGLDSTVLRPLR